MKNSTPAGMAGTLLVLLFDVEPLSILNPIESAPNILSREQAAPQRIEKLPIRKYGHLPYLAATSL